MTEQTETQLVDEYHAALMFQLARGRGGKNEIEDIAAMAALIRKYAVAGQLIGLQRAKEIYRSTTAATGCSRFFSTRNRPCNCCLCLLDREIASLKGESE